MPSRFDRVRPRTPEALEEIDLSGPASVDADGKRALFSTSSSAPMLGAVTVECSSCGAETALTLAKWLRAAVPSVHLPLLRRYPSFMRCPACGRRTWVRPHFRV